MTRPGTVEHREVDEPRPGEGEVLLRILRIGVCGSDVHVYHGEHPFTGYPVVQGHEFSARVEAIGPGVEGIATGDLVTALPQEVCGTCGPCRRGDIHICDNLKVRGFQAPGVAQDLFVTEAEKVVRLPADFSPEQGAFVEPVAVAVHATSRAGDLSGRNVAVLGAGPIGNLIAQMCRARGAHTLVTDLSTWRLERARACGIEHAFDVGETPLAEAALQVFGDEGFDIAFDCAGTQASVSEAVARIAKGGTIVLVAVYAEHPRVDLAVVGDRELTLTGTLMYQRPDYEEAVRRIAAGEIVTGPLESHHVPFDRYIEAYEYIERRGAECLKVFIDL